MGWHAPPSDVDTDNPLWQMALQLWDIPEFARACLQAQTEGVSVSHILVALFSASRNYRWNGREPSDIADWRTQVTQPLRALRQGLPREQHTTAPLRNHIKQSELESERLELAWWYHYFAGNNDWSPATGTEQHRLAGWNLENAGLGDNLAEQREVLIELWRSREPRD